MEHKLAFFKENGYYVEHGALQPDEVAQVIAGIEDVGGNSSDVFHHTEKLDLLCYHPNIFPLALRILGEGARLSGFNYGTAARGQRWATGGEDGTIGLAGADLWLAVANDTTVIDPADASPRVVLSRNRSAALSFEFLPAGRGQRGPEVWIKTTGKPKGQPAGLCLNDDAAAPRSKRPPKLPKGGIFLGGCDDRVQ